MTDFLSRFDAFHQAARDATGLTDFGPDDYEGPMRLLLSDYDHHSHLGPEGVAMLEEEIVANLVARLIAQHGFGVHPELANAPIPRPIFIIGAPRTGTTALLRMLTEDRSNQALELWLGYTPMPRPPRATWSSHPIFRQVSEVLERLYAMSPTIRRIHPMFPEQPDECRFTVGQTFWSPAAAVCAAVPNYRRWCLECDARFAYRRHRELLALIAGGDRRRWVLKDPSHLFALDALLEVFPDACIVQTHREPGISLASITSLIHELRRLREPALTRIEHGHEQLGIWPAALEKTEAVRRGADPAQFFDLHSGDIARDPAAAAESIYRYFGLPVSPEARAAWKRRATTDPRAGHGPHEYQPGDFGFSLEDVRARMPRYLERYASVAAQPQ